jgi:predicted nucleic acid-binding protein
LRDLVLDCSAVIAWLFPDEGDPFGLSLIDMIPIMRAHVPVIWRLEVTNALLMAERRGRLTQSDTAELLAIVNSVQTVLDREDLQGRMHQIISLGRAHKLSAYDAAYLELAMRLGVPIATLDDSLLQAAAAVGVKTFEA